jgi:hypothetical protein
MPSPASQLDLGPFDEVCIREVISRLSTVVGGSLRESVDVAVMTEAFGPEETLETAEAKVDLADRVDRASAALDALLVCFDAAFPAPPEPEEGF